MIRVEKSLGYIKYFLGFPIQLRSLSSHKIRGLGLGFPRKGVRAISGIPESRVSFPIVRLQGQDAISAVQITWDVLFRQGVDSSAFSGNVYVADSKREDLPHDVPRPVSYSWVKWRVPLKTNSILKDQFRLFHSDRIRIGKILELLDAFSADVAYRHVGGNMEEYTIVTACLDRLDFFDKLMYEEDLDLEGFMVRVGSSSMDVRVMISSVRGGYIGKADFLLVSREKFKEKSKPVPKLLLVNDEEKQLEHLATINRELKRRQELNSVWKVPPTSDESRVMHYLFKQSQNSLSRSYSRQASISSSTKVFSPEAGTEVGYVCMASTRISKSTIAQLQNRNVHNKSKKISISNISSFFKYFLFLSFWRISDKRGL